MKIKTNEWSGESCSRNLTGGEEFGDSSSENRISTLFNIPSRLGRVT